MSATSRPLSTTDAVSVLTVSSWLAAAVVAVALAVVLLLRWRERTVEEPEVLFV